MFFVHDMKEVRRSEKRPVRRQDRMVAELWAAPQHRHRHAACTPDR
jgi:hypothetical protein